MKTDKSDAEIIQQIVKACKSAERKGFKVRRGKFGAVIKDGRVTANKCLCALTATVLGRKSVLVPGIDAGAVVMRTAGKKLHRNPTWIEGFVKGFDLGDIAGNGAGARAGQMVFQTLEDAK